MMTGTTVRLGSRLKAARERAGLTQQDLAEAMRLEHRQTLAAIEAGERRLGADELLRAIDVLGVDLEYFTDSLRLVGDEGRFSFRSNRLVPPALLDEFEDRAGRWIALYRELEAEEGGQPQWLEQKLALTERSSFEDAQAAAQAIVERWGLGSRPAERLSKAIESNLSALVLHVTAPREISGAASQVPGLSVVLVNRDEPEGRRMFDIAHELFHILTWDAMAPKRVESNEPPTGNGKRIEQLAENFAAALLMPSAPLKVLWEQRESGGDLHEWLNRTASEFRVSAAACKWRVVNLGLLSKAEIRAIDDRRLVANGRPGAVQCPTRLFSEPFVRQVSAALGNGRLSVKRAASLLHMSVAELAKLLEDYGIEPQFEG
jgi:XRE family transcriptional regulator, fatty acid utilization regulator